MVLSKPHTLPQVCFLFSQSKDGNICIVGRGRHQENAQSTEPIERTECCFPEKKKLICAQSIEELRMFSEVPICPPTYPYTHPPSCHPSIQSSTHLSIYPLIHPFSPLIHLPIHPHSLTHIASQPDIFSPICLPTYPLMICVEHPLWARHRAG